MDDGKIFGMRGDGDDVWRVAAAGAFGVVGVNRAAGNRRNRDFQEARFVDRVGVDRRLERRYSSATFRHASMAAGVVAQSSCNFRPHAPASTCSASGAVDRRIALPQKTEIHGPRFGGFEHARQIPRARRAGGGRGAGGRTCAAADHRGDAVRKRFVNLLRRDEVDVAVDAAGGNDQIFSGDHFGGCADDQFRIDALHRVGITRFAHFDDAAVLDADVAL